MRSSNCTAVRLYNCTAVWLYDCTNNCVVCHVCLARGSFNCGLYVLGGQLRQHSDRRLVRVRIFDSLLPPPRLARLRKPSPARRRPPTSQAYGSRACAPRTHRASPARNATHGLRLCPQPCRVVSVSVPVSVSVSVSVSESQRPAPAPSRARTPARSAAPAAPCAHAARARGRQPAQRARTRSLSRWALIDHCGPVRRRRGSAGVSPALAAPLGRALPQPPPPLRTALTLRSRRRRR
eukprot:COSAG01_NODE_18805_length_1052_cov_0.901364_1_plen_236_part_01